MPQHPKPPANPEHDPALVALFTGSRKSYEQNVADLLADLDAAAGRTRQARVRQPAEPRKAASSLGEEIAAQTIKSRIPVSPRTGAAPVRKRTKA